MTTMNGEDDIGMTIKFVIIGAIVLTLLISSVSNVFAGGPRANGPEDSTPEADACWANGYDSGFAGKFDKERNDECQDEGEEGKNYYNSAWAIGCEDGPNDTNRKQTGRSVLECIRIMNNPVEIEDYEPLVQKIIAECRFDGEQDYNNGEPFHRERSIACSEFGQPYEEGYKSKFLQNHTEAHCMIVIRQAKNYCPFNRDVPECAEFLHNATN
jgi:hypothetical protein